MLKCIAIDDEELALELLEDNISKVPFLELVASSYNPLAGINIIQQEQIDLVFLDIQMPGLTGLQLIQSLPNKPMFILVTAYEKYALEGYNLNVVDYLVKPVPLDRFIKACNKAWELYQLKNKPAPSTREDEADYFFINVDYSHLKVVFNDILWIEGLKDYIKINLKSTAKPIVARISMKSLEDSLPSSKFIQNTEIIHCIKRFHNSSKKE
ncbi:MAG: response regulator [Segetibacter sp.]